jgi:alkylation response protein AidB-like acyl-CoA dehydrogenase
MNEVDGIESIESFRARLRRWLPDNLPKAPNVPATRMFRSDEEELSYLDRNRELQGRLFDGGFAGIIFPKEYGGAGLSPAHQQVFNEEIVGFEWPARLQVATFQPCATVILEFGTDEQKQRHIPPILRGEVLWKQFLTEPGGGSDVAGAQTTAVRDGEEWVLNGSKIWTTSAWWGDWALCLTRTNWDVPKHRGLTVFMFPIHQPGVLIQRIEMLDGSREFCQEFITDLRVPDRDRLGGIDDGWTVGRRWMFYERSFGISYHITRPSTGEENSRRAGPSGLALMELARRSGHFDDPVVRDMVGEGHALSLVTEEATVRIGQGVATGRYISDAAALTKVLAGTLGIRVANIAFQLAGASGVAWSDETSDLGDRGLSFLSRQAGLIGGGTVEMARNAVSERLLGMPRERTNDRDIAFRQVARGPDRAHPRDGRGGGE